MDMRNTMMPVTFAVVLIAGVQVGLQLNRAGRRSSQGEDSRISEVFDRIQGKYVDSVDARKIADVALNAILDELDPHSTYIPARQRRVLDEELRGSFQGIGIEFAIIDDTVTVMRVMDGGPSESAGIIPGDRIIKVNGESIAGEGMEADEVIGMLKGPMGTQVAVSLQGGRELVITRANVHVSSIEAALMIDDQTGYIRISSFSETTHRDFEEAIGRLKNSGMSRLVLDLRGNPGGLLPAAVEVAGEFLDRQRLIVSTKGRTYPEKEFRAGTNPSFPEGRVAVLIDEFSASASEIVAGALQDWDRALITGRRSFGKGLVQEEFLLSDSSALRLTVARYFTPLGRSIQKPYQGNRSKKDSLDAAHQFITPAGKALLGGGGIMPEIVVPKDSMQHLPDQPGFPDMIRNFSVSYYSSAMQEFAGYKDLKDFIGRFHAESRMSDSFRKYALRHGYPGIELSEPLALEIRAAFAQLLFGGEGYTAATADSDKVLMAAREGIN